MTGVNRPPRARGFEPPGPLLVPPIFERPPRPLAMLRYLLTSFLWPYHLLWIAIAVIAHRYASPGVDEAERFTAGLVGALYLRNVVLMLVVIGGLHVWLHVRRAQGTRFKYDRRWLATDRPSFLFGDQTRDNMFWSLGSAALVAALFEGFMLWMYANDRFLRIDWSDSWPYVAAMTIALFYIEGAHFYLNHRLLHIDPLYRIAHALHHKNVNTGPWSGVAMHPVEHVLYFSLPLVFVIVPGSPFLVTLSLVYLLLSPAPSHSGFDRLVVGADLTVPVGDNFHNLHHRYFECNYGVLLLPIDKWMGTFHDGTPEAHARMRDRRRAAARAQG